jgi:amino acid transporter
VPRHLWSPKRLIVGEPLATDKAEGQLLRKTLALPIFASDPLSSVAYAPQELILILALGGLSFLSFAPWIAAAVIGLMIVVITSYRQLIRAYPSGGGAYEVAHRNHGEKAGLVVASALLVDYVMTVAVSVASGVDNIISAFPGLQGIRVEMAVGCVAILVAINLRGVAESSRAFALPTYLFVGSMTIMIVTGLIRLALGQTLTAESAGYTVTEHSLSQVALILLLLRAFASGCSALTGVEAIANGVQAFKKPKIRNAQKTLVAMGVIAITLFAGVLTLALKTRVHYAGNPCDLQGFTTCATDAQRSVIAQIAASVFGSDHALMFYAIQATTAAVLLLAANTAFNGFPLLGSILARDRYAPKALLTRGDRLVFSNGVIILGLASALFLIGFRASLTQLIQLYIIGVFVSFTLGQTGMVVHWKNLLRSPHIRKRSIALPLLINAVGAASTGTVLIVVTVTKFTHGAWLVFAMMPLLFWLLLRINRYYSHVSEQVLPDRVTAFGSEGDHAMVLVSRLEKPTLKALDYAIAAQHASLEAVHVDTDKVETAQLLADWERHDILVKLTIVPSPFRDISTPIIDYIRQHRDRHGSEIVSVYMPQYVFGEWWEGFLHNRKARRVRQRLVLFPGVAVVLVPWLLDSSRALYTRPDRLLPGQERRGVPLRPIVRSALPTPPHGVTRAQPARASKKGRRSREPRP